MVADPKAISDLPNVSGATVQRNCISEAEGEIDSYWLTAADANGCFRPEADITGKMEPIPLFSTYFVNRNASSTRAKAGEGCLRLG